MLISPWTHQNRAQHATSEDQHATQEGRPAYRSRQRWLEIESSDQDGYCEKYRHRRNGHESASPSPRRLDPHRPAKHQVQDAGEHDVEVIRSIQKADLLVLSVGGRKVP